MCDVDAITFPFVDVVLHLKVEVGAMYVGFCGKELEDILFFLLPDIKGSSHCVRPFHGVPDFLDIFCYDFFGFGVFLTGPHVSRSLLYLLHIVFSSLWWMTAFRLVDPDSALSSH
ncbi:hypothetical protein STEG23_006021 [Scotinomys teguina]